MNAQQFFKLKVGDRIIKDGNKSSVRILRIEDEFNLGPDDTERRYRLVHAIQRGSFPKVSVSSEIQGFTLWSKA